MAERSVKSLELDAADTVHHSKTAKHSFNGLKFMFNSQYLITLVVCRSNHSLRLQWSTASLFYCKSFTSLSTSFFHVFLLLPLCLALSLQSNTFSPTHRHPFSKHVHIITLCFCVSLLLRLLFLTAALIQRKTVYPFIFLQHTSTYSFLFLPDAMPVHLLFSVTASHKLNFNVPSNGKN